MTVTADSSASNGASVAREGHERQHEENGHDKGYLHFPIRFRE